MSKLHIEGLSLGYGGPPVLRDVDLTVPEGTLVAVLGPSGCGKTSLLRAIAGFLTPLAGTIALGGRIVAGAGNWVPPEKRHVGLVPQEGALFPHLDVAGNVAFGLDRAGRRSDRVAELLDLVGLPGSERLRPDELSGGMQQRVAVARALAPRPALVLLDEPFSALDTTLRGSVRNDVRTALRADGATGVLVTHDQEEALSIADLVAVIRDGRLVQVGTPDEIYNNPADLGVARFVGESVVLPATSTSSGEVTCTLGSIPVRATASGDGVVVLRPEQFRLVSNGTDTARAADATVTATTYHGHDALVSLQLADGSMLCVRVLGAPSVHIGDRVGVAVDGAGTFFTE